MLVAQEKSAVNILHSMDVIIKDAYHTLLSDKQAMTQLKRRQLQSAARMIESVFTDSSELVTVVSLYLNSSF